MRTILLVEPSPVIHEPLAAVLQHAGFETLTASTASEALALTVTRAPDLIILEPSLRGMDGFWFLEHLRGAESTAMLPVIVLSSKADRAMVVQAARLQARTYMLKRSFSLDRLMEQVHAALKGPGKAAAAPSPPAPLAKPGSGSGSPAGGSVAKRQSSAMGAGGAGGAEGLRSIKPLLTRSDIKQCIAKCKEVKALSPSVAHLLNVTGRSGCTADQVVQAVKMDHAVALKVLKLANSAMYSRGDRIDSVKDAVLRIGTTQIRQTAMNLAVMESYSSTRLDDLLSIHQFWEHSIACGLIAAELATVTEIMPPDTAFTLGLLHDVGRIVLAEQLGDVYAEVMQTADRLGLPLEQVEKRMLLMTHADVMDRIMFAWRFPKALVNPILSHHLTAKELDRAPHKQTREAMVLALADRFAHAVMLGTSGNRVLYPIAGLIRRLGISAETLESIELSISDQTADMKMAMLSTASVEPWSRFSENCRELIHGSFRPIFVGVQPDTDPVRLLCDRLAREGVNEDNPSIIVVHIETLSDVEALSRQLVQEEQRAGATGLGVITVSSEGTLVLDKRVIGPRLSVQLPMPLHLDRFFAAIGKASQPGVLAAQAA